VQLILAFLSASGGAGKTTMAIHLAHMFSSKGERVLLIDLDPSAGLSTVLLGEDKVTQMERKKRTIGDALMKFLQGEDVELTEYVQTTSLDKFNVDIVPSGDALSDAIGIAWYSAKRPSPERLVRQFLEKSGISGWDIVILDTIPFYERHYTLTSFYAADNVIFVTHPYKPEPFRTKRMFDKLKEVMDVNIDTKARVLVNRVEAGTSEGRDAFKIIEETLSSLPHFQTIIHKRVAYSRVPQMGYLKDKDAKEEMEKLYNEIKDWLNSPYMILTAPP